MSQSTTRFITQMKLRELDRQRVRLRESYQQLAARAADEVDPARRLRGLYDGLRALTLAGRPLHPDVNNLEILLHEAEAGSVAPELLGLWLDRLDDELAAGQARAEVVYLFGALLEEWSRGSAGDDPLGDEARQARDRLIAAATLAPPPNRHDEILGPLLADFEAEPDDMPGSVPDRGQTRQNEAINPEDLVNELDKLGKDIYRSPPFRREARRFAADALLRKDLADALTILVADRHAWNWPAEGMTASALWTRNKWRLYLDEDLPTACFLGAVAELWEVILGNAFVDQSDLDEHRATLHKLVQLKAPPVIVEGRRRMIQNIEQALAAGRAEPDDPWRAIEGNKPKRAHHYGSIIHLRAQHQRLLKRRRVGGDYDGDSGALDRAILLVNAEVRLARAAFPDRPLFVVKVDLLDYFPSLPHDLLLSILRKLGIDQDDLDFFERFLTPPLQVEGGEATRARRGVPMNHALSELLAELVMTLMERHITRRARVRIVRLGDDLGLLTPDADAARAAWQAAGEFCAACGLQVNAAKSGAVAIGAKKPEGLPDGRPRWGMLELDELGRWDVHAATLDAHLAQSRARVEAAPSILSRVQQYNADAKHLIAALVPGGQLGDSHRLTVARAVRHFHGEFFGPGRGIVAGLDCEIRSRFPAQGAATLPEGWLHWPLTAGGLGLFNPTIVLGQYAEAHRRAAVDPPTIPERRGVGWDRRDNKWANYYRPFLTIVEPSPPAATKVARALVDDFIARGAEISAGRQQDLDPYWRWVLCIYGPQILQRFGTFRFLITELVPLQLIGRQLVQDSSLDRASSSGDEFEGEETP